MPSGIIYVSKSIINVLFVNWYRFSVQPNFVFDIFGKILHLVYFSEGTVPVFI